VRVLSEPSRNGSSGTFSEINPFSGTMIGMISLGKELLAKAAAAKNKKERARVDSSTLPA
jgi:hypothetical protein